METAAVVEEEKEDVGQVLAQVDAGVDGGQELEEDAGVVAKGEGALHNFRRHLSHTTAKQPRRPQGTTSKQELLQEYTLFHSVL